MRSGRWSPKARSPNLLPKFHRVSTADHGILKSGTLTGHGALVELCESLVNRARKRRSRHFGFYGYLNPLKRPRLNDILYFLPLPSLPHASSNAVESFRNCEPSKNEVWADMFVRWSRERRRGLCRSHKRIDTFVFSDCDAHTHRYLRDAWLAFIIPVVTFDKIIAEQKLRVMSFVRGNEHERAFPLNISFA